MQLVSFTLTALSAVKLDFQISRAVYPFTIVTLEMA
jgi:hypothetical protein